MVSISDTSIRFRCPNDHKLRVPVQYEGRRVACPVCSTSMVVGEVAPAPITESGAFRILSACDAESFREEPIKSQSISDPVAKPANPPVAHQCPRCRHSLDIDSTRCPECKLCLDSNQKVLQRIYKAALRTIR